MPFVNRPAPLEPDEKPTAIGRHIWTVCHESPGEWRVVYEDTHRQRVVTMEGCLIGRGQARIAPMMDLTGWDARMIERPDDTVPEGVVYELLVRYTPPKVPNASDVKADGVLEKLRKADEPETARVSGSGKLID